jgi:hypothetical protein
MRGPTWRNIDAPNLSTSMAAIAAATDNFNKGLAAAKSGVNEFDAKQTERMNAAFQTALLGQQDSGEFAKAISADPTLGFDPRRLNAQSVSMAGNWMNNLLSQDNRRQDLEVGAENLAQSRWKFGEDQSNVAQQKELGQLYLDVQPMLSQGNAAGALAEFQKRAAGRGLKADAISGFMKDAFGFEKTTVDIAGQRQDQTFRAQDQSFKVEDRQFESAAASLAEAVMNQYAPGANVAALIDQNSKGMNPRAVAMARTMIGNGLGTGFYGDMSGGGAGGFGVDPSGKDKSGVMNYEARAAGFDSVPASVKTLGQAVSFGKQVNRAGANSSAMGIFQITQSTMQDFGQRLYGKDWVNKEWTPEVQEELGQAIFESSKGSAQALKGRWVSLSLAEAEQVRKLPWDQAKRIIAQKESGHDFGAGGVNPKTASITNDARKAGISEDTLADGRKPIQVAAAIAKSIPGSDQKALLEEIRSLVNQSRNDQGRPTLTAAQAGDIILQNVTTDKRWDITKYLGLGEPGIGGGYTINRDAARERAAGARRGERIDAQVDIANADAEVAGNAQAKAAYDAANSRVQQIRRMQLQGRTGLDRELTVAMIEAEAAKQAWQQSGQPIVQRAQKERTPPKAKPKPVKREQGWGMIGTLLAPW